MCDEHSVSQKTGICLLTIYQIFKANLLPVYLHSQRRFIVYGFVNSCKCRHLPEQDGPVREEAIEG